MARLTMASIPGPAANVNATTTSGTTAVAAQGKKTRIIADSDIFIRTGGADITVTTSNGYKLPGGSVEYFDTSQGYFAVVAASGTINVNYGIAEESA